MTAINEAFGGEPNVALSTQIGQMAQRLEDIAGDMGKAKDEDTARYDALKAEQAKVADNLTVLKDKHDAEVREAEVKAALATAAEWKQQLANVREPSKVTSFGDPAAKAKGYTPGDFLWAVHEANANDHDRQSAGKAMLAELGLNRAESEGKANLTANWSGGKATLGTTDATGGWVIPNSVVADFIAPASYRNIYRDLMTTISGVTASHVDQPFRLAARARAVVALAGDTKENVGLVYNGYTATMYTIARIYDVANQFLRQSRGAAEQDVLQELAAAFAAGESYYIREGSGTNEPFGYTSALTNGPAAFRSAFTASATTLAGSIAKAVATAAGALAGRGVTPTAAVLSAGSYWNMVSQGTDTAGFFFAPAGGPTNIRPGTLMSPFGLPVYADPGADSTGTAAVTDNLTVADWKAFKVYFGESYRVDSSDQAGTRWDTNLTGFRGEEEMGFDARSVVYAGYAQQIADVEA